MKVICIQNASISRLSPCADRHKQISLRETQVLDYAHLGVRDMATALGCAPGTIKHHRAHIMEKLGASNWTEATLIWRDAQLERAA